jgi:hypothetical protein
MAEIRHHIADEEGEMFAHMRQATDADELPLDRMRDRATGRGTDD